MKPFVLATSLALGLSLISARGQFFTTGTLANDGSNLVSVGPVFEAIDIDNTGSNPTVNGIHFTSYGTTPDAGPGSGPSFTLSSNVLDNGTNHGVLSTDAIYPLVAEGSVNTSTRSMTLTLTGLTVGVTYSAQLIFDTSDTSGRSASITDNGVTSSSVTAGTSSPPGAVFITDKFFATSTTETLLINDTTSIGGRTPLNFSAFVVDAPEPSTWALLAVGAVGLVAFQARRRTA